LSAKRQSNIRASFRFKIFSIFTTLTFFITCTFITLHVLDKSSESRRHARKEIHLLARQLGDSIRLPLYAENTDQLNQLAQNAGSTPGITSITVTTADGRVLADFRARAGTGPGDPISETAEVQSLPVGTLLDNGLSDGKVESEAPIGSVRIVRGTGDLQRALYQDVGYSCLLALLFWLAVTGLSLVVFRRLTRSFDALVDGVRAMQSGDFSTRIDVVSADEPAMVATAINGLALSLQEREAENARLTRDLVASIELEVLAGEELACVNRTLELENAERLQAERAARNSEQTLRTLMDIMPVGVFLTDQDGTVQYVNEFLVEWFGYGREQVTTLDAWFALAFPDPDYRREMAAAQRAAMAQGRNAEAVAAKPFDARVTCQGGSVRHVLFSNQVQGEQAIVVVVDITDRELAQEQSLKVQKLESLGVLAGGIAHNFNNALTGVLGFISLTRSTLLQDSQHSHEYLQFAEKAALRAAGMAKQLLTFARGGEPVKKALSLSKLVSEVAALALNGSKVHCKIEMPESLPLVRGDEGQLIQALSNIVINAMQAMPGGGTITIRAQSSMPGCGDPNHCENVEYVSLSISDQGHGISEGDLSRIFDPYFTTKSTNTGLGLASVHSIVYRHGGHVSVTSQPGIGTTFTLCLPSTREAMQPDGEPAAQLQLLGAGSRAGGSVLIMDDDETVRVLSRKMLAFLGYQAVVCADGKEAVSLYKTSREAGSPFLAVILDLTVPGGMGGVEAARQILAIDPAAKLIVSSGYSFDPVMARHKNYGFCGAVAKPYKAEELGHELSHLY
jgi:two-component system, cell cycle sensor histidine kinase and response regulator CckA